MKLLLRLIAICSCIAFPTLLNAQLLPPNQPEQDACNALMICGNTFTSPYGYQGTGLVADLTNTPCYGGEANAMWLRLEITSPGILVFNIAPLITSDDYDFAIVDITGTGCANTSTAPVIRCDFNNNLPPYNNGMLGLNTTSTTLYGTSGVTGLSYLQQINANTGDVYLIMINNFGTGFTGPTSGFTIDFTGSTAVFNQPPPPTMQQILPYCDLSSHLTIETNTQVLCSSLATNGSDFYVTPTGTIASVEGLNCTGASGYTSQIKVNFSSPLPNGDYSIHAKVGSDGNTLLGLCNAALALPDSLNFHVGLDPIAMISIDSPACQLLKINLNTPAACNSIAANGSDFTVTGPSGVTVASATGTNCTPGGFTSTVELTLSQPIAVDGIYQIHSMIGNDGNSLMDSCGRILPPQLSIPFVVNSFNGLLQAGPDSTICNLNSYVTLYGINNGPPPSSGFNYQWTPTTNVSYPNSQSTPLLVPGFRNYYILQTIDANGCYLRDSAKILVKPFTAALSPIKAEGCIGDPIPLHASEGSTYNWFDDANLSSVPTITLNCTNCPNPLATPPLGQKDYFVLVTNTLGCKDTLKVSLTIHDRPVIESFPADTTIKYGQSIMLHAFGGSVYSWSPGSSLNDNYAQSPIATPKNPTTYVVTGANEFGCMSTDTSIINIDYRQGTMIPNAFSPNGDGLNDVFKVMNINFRKLIAFRVFDRWGNKVFETNDANIGWDGTYKGKKMAIDVYYYFIQLGYEDETVETFKGDVTLLQ